MEAKRQFQCSECDVAGTYVHNLVTHWYGAHYRYASKDERRKLKKDLLKKVEDEHDANKRMKAEKLIKEQDSRVSKDLDEVPVLFSEIETIDSETVKDDFQAEEHGGFNLKHFLDSDRLVCREERHFAFLLAARLADDRDDQAGILRELTGSKDAQARSIKILSVMYEVTLMRDFWSPENRRDEVRSRLYKFLEHKKEIISEEGADSELRSLISEALASQYREETPYSSRAPKLVRWMMKAKPDIGVVWRDQNKPGKVYLTFLECKFLSSIGRYGGTNGTPSLEQTAVQELILEFLCSDPEHGLALSCPGKNGNPERVIGDGVHIVQFTHKCFPQAKLSGSDPRKSNCEIGLEDLL